MHLDLAMRLGLETFDDHEIDRRHLLEQFRQPRLGRAAQLMHQGPSPAGGHQNFGGAGLPVHPGILARYVDIKTVVGVLDHGNTQALAKQMRDDTRQQRRLAGAAPAREAYHFHLTIASSHGTRPIERHCGERSDEAIQLLPYVLDCFAEPVFGRRFAPTRWLAMTTLDAFRSYSKMLISANKQCHASLPNDDEDR